MRAMPLLAHPEAHEQHMHWQEQIRQSVTSLEELRKRGFETEARDEAFPMRITPHILGLMEKNTARCPIGRQFVPLPDELHRRPAELEDPVLEENCKIAGALIHAYPDRGLFMTNQRCATYCRYCFRKRLVGREAPLSDAQYEEAFAYLRDHPEVHEAILSGGEVFLLADERIEWFLAKLSEIRSIKVVRIHTRTLSNLPQRITPELAALLEKYRVPYLNTQINHPRELTPETETAVQRLRAAGVAVGNQCVLLRGVNDDVETMRRLCLGCYHRGIQPYYIFHCDYTMGTAHFRTSIARGKEIYHGLQGWISGMAVPKYALDSPAHRKVLITPEYVTDNGDGTYTMRNFRNETMRYDETALLSP